LQSLYHTKKAVSFKGKYTGIFFNLHRGIKLAHQVHPTGMKILHSIVPKQKIGAHTGATAKVTNNSRHDAIVLFNACKNRLLDINNWYHYSGDTGARFVLTDATGKVVEKVTPKKGDLIRIQLPAPPNKDGDGYDWVRIEEFEEKKEQLKDEELFGFRVRPVRGPNVPGKDSSHFYTSDATGTFIVLRRSSTVYVMERGRNEKPNFTGDLIDKLRNTTIALAAILGLAKPQWKNLVKGILHPPA
jgi:hypothetical protein